VRADTRIPGNMHQTPRSRQSLQGRLVVYTCLFGYYEHFNDFKYELDDQIDFVCFTDDPHLRSDFWRVQGVLRGLLDPARCARRVKILPHRYFANYEYSLYLDNTVRLKRPPREIFETLLAPSSSPLVCFRHPWRSCIYDEAEAVAGSGLADPNAVAAQIDLYREIGYPRNNGLSKGAFLLRRHNDPHLIEVMETWYEQVLRYASRDQLSLPVAAWNHRFKIEHVDLDFAENDLLEWPAVKDNVRLPRDFDERRYRALNPDVVIDARKHYLLYGASEQRRYK
jgi:hypothetical protein